MEELKCKECGQELKETDTFCPNCGCPVNTEKEVQDEKPQKQSKEISIKINKKTLIILAIVIVAIIGGVVIHNEMKKQEEIRQQEIAEEEARKAAEEAAAEAQRISEEYETNLKAVSVYMLSGAADAEECGNLIKSVWSNSIWNTDDEETDKYTKDANGVFYDDFNDALGVLFSDSDYLAKISDLKDNQDDVTAIMTKLKNPPEEWEDAYDDVKDFYDSYYELTNMVISPSGSLQTFSTNFSNADSETVNCFNRMEQYFEF